MSEMPSFELMSELSFEECLIKVMFLISGQIFSKVCSKEAHSVNNFAQNFLFIMNVTKSAHPPPRLSKQTVYS